MHILLLAGGGGTRLWPFSRLDYPKQFLHFGDRYSLLQKTILRCLKISSADNIVVITNAQYLSLVEQQIQAIAPGRKIHILVEPLRKNTAPAICLGLKYLEETLEVTSREKVLVLPSDHQISPEEEFVTLMEEVNIQDFQKKILVFGIPPTDPETGYGYIRIKDSFPNPFYAVERFIEKPSLEKAKEYLSDASFFWNSGMFCFSLSTFWKELSLHAPDLEELTHGSYQDFFDRFSLMPSISIDHALMEKTKELSLKPLTLQWSDVGSWDSVYKMLDKDLNFNVKRGNVLDIDTTNSLIMGGKRLISTIGLDDMLIVETSDAIFLSKKGKSQEVKALVEKLQRQGLQEIAITIDKPCKWLKRTEDYSLRILTIPPSESLTLQTHNEKITVLENVSGYGRFALPLEQQPFQTFERIEIKGGKEVFIENEGERELELLYLEKNPLHERSFCEQ